MERTRFGQEKAMKSAWKRVAAACAIGFTMLVVAVSVTLSAPAAARAETFTYCSEDLDTGVVVCADSPEDLVAETGAIDDPGPVPSAAHRAAAASYLIGQVFSHPSYTGSMYQYTSSSTCASGWKGIANLAGIGWDNDIDSFKSFSGCTTRLYDGTNYTGATYGWATSAANLGSMQNRASSIAWAP